MKQTTVHRAKIHFSRVLAEVEAGGEVLVCRGTVPVAIIVPYPGNRRLQPKAGIITSKPVRYADRDS